MIAKSIKIITKPKAAQLVSITTIMAIGGSQVLTRSVHTTLLAQPRNKNNGILGKFYKVNYLSSGSKLPLKS